MWEEEYPLPGYQTETERLVVWQFTALGVFSTWPVAGDFSGGPEICVALALVTPFLYAIFSNEPRLPTEERQCALRWWSLLPLLLIGLWFAGQFFPSVSFVDLGGNGFFERLQPDSIGPVSGLPWQDWLVPLYLCTLLMASVGFTLLVDSQHAVARLMWGLVINAMILGTLGMIGAIMRWKKMLTLITPAQPDFFSVFPQAQQWTPFALFWVIAGFGLLFHLKRRNTWGSLLENNGIWLIAGWLILAVSVYWTGAPVHRLLLWTVVGLLLFRVGTALIRHLRANRWSPPLGVLICLFGAAALAGGLYQFIDACRVTEANPDPAPFGIPWSIQSALWRDTWDLFLQRPFFGWGLGSFDEIFAFRQQVDLGNVHYANCHSDILLALCEQGLVGLGLWLVFPLTLLIRFLNLPYQRNLSHYLWGGVTALGALALVSAPLSSPANLVLVWTGLVCAYQWSHTATHATPLPIGSQLIVPIPGHAPKRHRKVEAAPDEAS